MFLDGKNLQTVKSDNTIENGKRLQPPFLKRNPVTYVGCKGQRPVYKIYLQTDCLNIVTVSHSHRQYADPERSVLSSKKSVASARYQRQSAGPTRKWEYALTIAL